MLCVSHTRVAPLCSLPALPLPLSVATGATRARWQEPRSRSFGGRACPAVGPHRTCPADLAAPMATTADLAPPRLHDPSSDVRESPSPSSLSVDLAAVLGSSRRRVWAIAPGGACGADLSHDDRLRAGSPVGSNMGLPASFFYFSEIIYADGHFYCLG